MDKKFSETIEIVIPVFNEEKVIKETIKRLEDLIIKNANYLALKVIFVDDGSVDKTSFILKKYCKENCNMRFISLSRNFGHQIAITAGLDNSVADYVAIIDADLQDPPELIIDMYKLALEGYEVVYGRRKSREGESFLKKITAKVFYRLINYLCDIELPKDTGDFRLLSRKAIDAFKLMRERHRYVRGMIPWIGFNQTYINYDRKKRFAGETKYPLRKMLAFSNTAIISFSKKPLILAMRLGTIISLSGLISIFYIIYF